MSSQQLENDDGSARTDNTSQLDAILKAVSGIQQSLKVHAAAIAKLRKGRARNSESDSFEDGSSEHDDDEASDESMPASAADILEYAPQPVRFRLPATIDPMKMKRLHFAVPDELRLSREPITQQWVRSLYEIMYSAGHAVEYRIGAVAAYLRDFKSEDADIPAQFLEQTVDGITDMLRNGVFLIDRICDEPTEGKMLAMGLRRERPTHLSSLERRAAEIRDKQSVKALEKAERQRMDRAAAAMAGLASPKTPEQRPSWSGGGGGGGARRGGRRQQHQQHQQQQQQQQQPQRQLQRSDSAPKQRPPTGGAGQGRTSPAAAGAGHD